MATTVRPILLLLGSGSNTGASTISLFTSHSFLVAAVSRSCQTGISTTNTSILNIAADLSDPSCIPSIFTTINQHWGAPPSVVVYNPASRTLCAQDSPLSGFDLKQFQYDTNLNVTTAITAAQYAIEGFDALPQSPLKTFIYTGNKLPRMPSPQVLTFGMHKSAVAHMIWDLSHAYQQKNREGEGYKFYFADQRFEDGSPAREQMFGDVAAGMMLELVRDGRQREWYHTVVKGKGYVDLREADAEAQELRGFDYVALRCLLWW